MKTKAGRMGLFTLICGALFIYGAPGQAEPAGAAPAASADDEPLVCSASGSPFIDDLEDGNTSTLDGFGGWYEFDDKDEDPGSTSPLTEVSITSGGAGRSRFAARIEGSGFEYAGMGVALGCARDAGAFEGYRFAVKAGGTRSFDTKVPISATVDIASGGACAEQCNDHFSTHVSLSDSGWYECSVRFRDLQQLDYFPNETLSFDPRTVMGVEFIATGEDQSFDITVDNVEFAADVAGTGCVPIQRRPAGHHGHHGQAHGGH